MQDKIMLKIAMTLLLEQTYADEIEPLKCMVTEIEEGTFYIDYPVKVKTGKPAFLVNGTQLKATFTDAKKGTFIFYTEVLKKVKGNIPMLQLLLPPVELFIKIQRRQFVRVETRVDVAVHPKNGEFVPFRTVTEDLSAGGAALRLTNNMTIHDVPFIDLRMALPLNSGEISYLLLHCKVIRMGEEKNDVHILSIQFIEPSQHDVQIIMRYIFEKQVDLKKAGFIE